MQGLSEQHENYLETILILETDEGVARVKDIAARLGVQSGTVTSALKSLSEKGFINYKPYSFITLTPAGKDIAREVLRRHGVIRNFLENVLLLDGDIAEENACRMEHYMDRPAVNRLVQFIEYIRQCPRTGSDWVANFHTFYTRGRIAEADCAACLDECIERYKKTVE